ncbi:MAG: hypothetical protein NC344_01810 [Bacteroidales bacterium]|nr:hypothetical protein [Bacteroidales bacterium]MCM1146569.1 hypothetical protein [Bacteroidales bacterium]MCM1205961.1 hypothetical protein [Bacillota bacterium]MCM1510159.1 hypothetical protein [Clostridium sp.]
MMKAYDESGLGNAGIIAISRLQGTGGTRHHFLTAQASISGNSSRYG